MFLFHLAETSTLQCHACCWQSCYRYVG